MEIRYFTNLRRVILAYIEGVAENWLKGFIEQIGFIDIWYSSMIIEVDIT